MDNNNQTYALIVEFFNNFKDRTKELKDILDIFFRMNLSDKFLFTKNLVVQDASLRVNGRIYANKGSDVASATNLNLSGDGNVFTITGTTTINAISVSTWSKGSEVTLIFAASCTVKHNTAGSTGTAKIFLSGSVDLSAALNTVLTLVYDGTQWQEKCRKVA